MDERDNEDWKFLVTAEGWYWERAEQDGTKRRSQGHFESMQECMSDAAKAGYSRWRAARQSGRLF